MLVQFKDLKQGDVISKEGALFELGALTCHDFENDVKVITVRAKFLERRAFNNIVVLFNKRKRPSIELEKGLSLQGFSDETLDVVIVKQELNYG